MQAFLGRHTRDEICHHYEQFIAPYCTDDGQAALEIGDAAVDTVAADETR
ncbi:hypothetical protein ACQP2P_15305 [Dactylosporangium sp. CA-139114]